MQANEWIRRQRLKDAHFDPSIFAGPGWNLFLGLYTARLEAREMSVAAACDCAGVPTVTALRWIDVLIDAGFARRMDGNVDMRRAALELTGKAVGAMDALLAEIEAG